MYDRAEAQASNDRLWALIRDGMRAEGLAAPDALTRGAGAYWDAWQAPDLTLSQTCGFPYRARLHGHVTLIGTPDYRRRGLPARPLPFASMSPTATTRAKPCPSLTTPPSPSTKICRNRAGPRHKTMPAASG